MQHHTKLQKWGNSTAIRLPATALAAAGIKPGSEVDIQTSEGRLVIQLPERTQEQLFEKLMAEIPDAETVLKMVQECLARAIAMTDETTRNVELLCDELSKKQERK